MTDALFACEKPPGSGRSFAAVVVGSMVQAVAGASLLCAQEGVPDHGADPFSETVEVRLVEVEASVFDKKGRRVSGLTREDFVLFVDGESTEIVDFEELTVRDLIFVPDGRRARPPGGLEQPPAPNDDRSSAPLVALFLDEGTLTGGVGRTLRRSLTGVFEQAGAERLDWVLLRWSGTLEVDQLGAVTLEGLVSRIAEPGDPRADQVVVAELRRRAVRSIASAFESRAVLPNLDPCEFWNEYASHARDYGLAARQLALERLAALEAAIEAASAFMRPTTLIALTDQISLRPGIDGFDYVEQICPEREREIRQMMFEMDVTPQIQRVAARANAGRVTLVMVDAAGLRTSSGSSVDSTMKRLAPSSRNDRIYNVNAQGSLMQLASETGGSAVFNTNDLVLPISQAINRSQSNYRITYRAGSQDGRLHTIGVQLARLGDWRVDSRRSWLDRTVEQTLADGIRSYVLYGIEPPASSSPALVVEAAAGLTAPGQLPAGLELDVRIAEDVTRRLMLLDDRQDGRLRLWAFAAHPDYRTSARQQLLRLEGQAMQVRFVVPLDDAQRRDLGWRVGLGVRDEATGEVWMEVLAVHSAPLTPP